MSEEPEADAEAESQSGDEEPHRRPPWMKNRLGSPGMGSAVPIEAENIPDSLMEDPLYWYGRYKELEKAYQDLGSQLQQNQWNQQSRMFHAQNSDDMQDLYRRIRGVLGIFTSMFVVLQVANAQGYISISPLTLVGATIAITTIFDAVSLTSLLGKVSQKVRSLFPIRGA